MAATIDKTRAAEIIKEILAKSQKRLVQEVSGENEENLDRVATNFRSKISRATWKIAQKWSKWENDGPILMPDYTRIFYKKGNTEVLLLEYPPQVRLMRFTGALSSRSNSSEDLEEASKTKVNNFTLAIPYVIFIFKFVDGMFQEVRCCFSDRPLKKLDEKPLRPYLPNLDSNLKVCLGRDFDNSNLEKGNIAQQSAYILSHFWQSVYSDEWSAHYWDSKTHFTAKDPRMATLDAWQAATLDNPLFVIEDVDWLKHAEEEFGAIIVRLFDNDKKDGEFSEEIYKELSGGFIDEAKNTVKETFANVEAKISDSLVNEMVEFLLESLKKPKSS